MDIQTELDKVRELARKGKRLEARENLRRIISVDKYNEEAWILFAEVAEKPAHEEQCLRTVLRINPQNQFANQRLTEINSRPESKLPRKKIIVIFCIVVFLIICCCVSLVGWNTIQTYNPNHPTNIVPIATNVTILVDAPSLLGLTPQEVRSLSFVEDGEKMTIPIGADDQFPNGGFYFYYIVPSLGDRYLFDLKYTPKGIAKVFHTDQLSSYHLRLKDWSTIVGFPLKNGHLDKP